MSEPQTQQSPSTVALEILTDEELSLLTDGSGPVVSPILAALPDAERDVARRTAFRGLVARGIVDPPSSQAAAEAKPTADGEASVALRVREDVLSALTLRQSASSVVAVARTTASGQDFWYAHVVDEVTLLEQVSSDGMHKFALAHSTQLADLLVGATLYDGACDATGAPVVLTEVPVAEAPAELTAQLGEAYVRADVAVLSRGAPDEPQPTLTGLFTGPSGSWSVVADPASRQVTARPERVADLHRRVHELAASATGQPEGVAR